MPNVMAPNIGGALCSMSQVWLTLTTRVPRSNAAKTLNPLKFAGVLQTRQQISAISRPKFTILWEHVEDVSMFNSSFTIVDTCLSCEDTVWQSCAIVPKWRFFASCILNLHYGHTVCGSMVDIQSPTAEIRRGKKDGKKKKIEITGQKI